MIQLAGERLNKLEGRYMNSSLLAALPLLLVTSPTFAQKLGLLSELPEGTVLAFRR